MMEKQKVLSQYFITANIFKANMNNLKHISSILCKQPSALLKSAFSDNAHCDVQNVPFLFTKDKLFKASLLALVELFNVSTRL